MPGSGGLQFWRCWNVKKTKSKAAKAVKYGDISEEEAWKFVTLNPAKLCMMTK
jgi:imidazolonepropionase-like amidohydrolase